jgi:hypothetical protein
MHSPEELFDPLAAIFPSVFPSGMYLMESDYRQARLFLAGGFAPSLRMQGKYRI